MTDGPVDTVVFRQYQTEVQILKSSSTFFHPMRYTFLGINGLNTHPDAVFRQACQAFCVIIIRPLLIRPIILPVHPPGFRTEKDAKADRHEGHSNLTQQRIHSGRPFPQPQADIRSPQGSFLVDVGYIKDTPLSSLDQDLSSCFPWGQNLFSLKRKPFGTFVKNASTVGFSWNIQVWKEPEDTKT